MLLRFRAWLGTPVAAGIGALGSFFCALVVIVVPLIRQQLARDNVEIFLPKSIALSHNVGVMEITPWITLRNDGGRRVDIESLRLKLVDSDKVTHELVADAYLDGAQLDQNYLPWAPLAIEQGKSWSGRIKFKPELTDSDEDTYRQLRLDFARAREVALDKLPKDGPPVLRPSKPDAPVSQENRELLNRAKVFFDKEFFLKKGEYEIAAVADSSTQRELALTRYKFVVYESTLSEIKNISESKVDLVNNPFPRVGLLFDQDDLALSVPLKFVERKTAAEK